MDPNEYLNMTLVIAAALGVLHIDSITSIC